MTYPVTFFIIIINIIIFIIELFFGWSTNNLVAYKFWALYTEVLPIQYWRLFTSMFLHFGVVHIAMNMLALYNIWPLVEKTFWKIKYLIIYLWSGLAWNLLIWLIENLTWTYNLSAWASGAIFWILWALVAFNIVMMKRTGKEMDIKQLLLPVIYALAPGFFIPWISLSAHIWWLIGWFLLWLLFSQNKDTNVTDIW